MKKILIVGLALIACFGAVNMASAKPGKTFDTNVTLRADETGPSDYTEGFRGRVSSRKDRCEAGRVVRIIKQGDGEVGRTRSNQQGQYAVAFGGEDEYAENGRYFARVSPKFLNKSGNTRLCKVGKSQTVTVRN